MRKKIIILAAIAIFSSSAILANNIFLPPETAVNKSVGGNVKILNDTDADVRIHTGSGFVEINKTSSTSVSCEAGKEIRLADKGKKGDVIFVIDESMCGKTVKLSKYL